MNPNLWLLAVATNNFAVACKKNAHTTPAQHHTQGGDDFST